MEYANESGHTSSDKTWERLHLVIQGPMTTLILTYRCSTTSDALENIAEITLSLGIRVLTYLNARPMRSWSVLSGQARASLPDC